MTDTATRITLIRHGLVHNPDNIIYGRLPGFGLSETGRKQVEAAARELSDQQLAALYCSPQQRAEETADILLRCRPDLKAIISPMIDETDSYFEGRPAQEVEARGWDLYTGISNGYETPEEIGTRAGSFILRTRVAHQGQHVAAVTHGDVIAFAVLWALQQPLDVALKRTLDRYGIKDRYPATASLTTLIYHSEDPREVPKITYVRPYAENLTTETLS